ICLWLTWMLVGAQILVSLSLRRGLAITAFGDIAQCTLIAFATEAAWTNIKSRDRRAARFWALMALGCGLWFASQVMWAYFEVVLRKEAPQLFIGDVVLFVHLVPMMGAMALQPHVERDQHSARLGTLDFALLLTWWMYLYLYVVIPWQYVSVNIAVYGKNFNVLYFVEHTVFLASAALVWWRSEGPWKVVYRDLLGAGFLYPHASISASIAIDNA